MKTNDGALVLLVAVEGAFAYSAFLPSVFTIREHVGPDAVGDIRAGEALASAFVVVLAGATAKILGSTTPLYVGALTIAAMVSVYEYALAHPRPVSKG